MKIQYIDKRFTSSSLEIIDYANAIINDFGARGHTLTLRQLYYQMVARNLIANRQKSYDRLGNILSNARLAGIVDWSAIEDRTRNLAGLPEWSTPASIVQAAHDSYRIDWWQGQDFKPEVWVEKEALAGVVARACRMLDVDYMSCKGYMSQSEMWSAGRRFKKYDRNGQEPIVIHLGDHDPSGIHMTEDIENRLALFSERYIEVKRIALNIDQVQQYSLPPNPAKLSDTRAGAYIKQFGYDSWELDALDPDVIIEMIDENVKEYRDDDLYEVVLRKQKREKAMIMQAVEVMK